MYWSNVGSAGNKTGGCWIAANSVLIDVENIQTIGNAVKASRNARKSHLTNASTLKLRPRREPAIVLSPPDAARSS